MAEHPEIPTEVDANIDESLGNAAPKKSTRVRKQAVYKMVGDSKIPVSKSTGKVWKSRLNQGKKHTQNVTESWDEAIRYFQNDQSKHRTSLKSGSGNVIGNQRLNSNITETENVVFANVTTMVPALYARNPEAEFTSHDDEKKRLATITERLVNVIGNRRAAPGINLKPKAKRCVVTCLLTNRAWIKIGWIHRSESSEQALTDLADIAVKLEKAKDAKKIVELEGQLMALEQSIDVLQPSGPFATVKTPHEIIVDSNAKEIDLSDANWVIEEDMLPTEFILAKYAQKKKGSTEYMSIYQSTHVMKATLQGDDAHDNSSESFNLYDTDKDIAKDFGFTDEDSFEKAKMTKVYKVWDKVTRRVLLFNANDWTWPIWVWDDPLQLDTFYPFYALTFFESPSGPLTKGEVSYYLDQQDAINEITDEMRRVRRWGRRNVVYNKNVIDAVDVEAILNGDDGTARGVNVEPEVDLSKVISTIAPPSIQYQAIFDKTGYYEAIDRISSVGTVMRGEQFKTNTNKAAVQANAQAANMRVDEKADQIEDWIGQIYWGIAQLCLMNMPKEQVIKLIGKEGEEWENMSKEEVGMLSQTVVGGSTKKPTSAAKKEEALEFGQVLGQFVNAAPGPVLKIMLQVMEKAFDEVTMREEDWTELKEAITQQQEGGQQQQQQQPQQGQPPDVASMSPEQLQQILQQLPPEIKQEVQSAIQSGVPAEKALQAAIQQMQQAQQQQPPQQ